MAVKKVTVNDLLRCDDFRDFVDALNIEPREVESLVLVFRNKDGDVLIRYKSTSAPEVVGLLEIGKQFVLNECKGNSQ